MVESAIKHIHYQIPPEAHTPMYVWHKYFGRKPWNIVSRYIANYCPPDGIVIDPFAGSGVTAMEALKLGRKVIAIDINPMASAIMRATIEPFEVQRILKGFNLVASKVKDKIQQYYSSQCRSCRKPVNIIAGVYKRNRNLLHLEDVRYRCPLCGHEAYSNTSPSSGDRKLIKNIPALLQSSGYWYPNNKLYYNGQPFREKQRYESVDELFTPRNLLCLAILMDAIEDERNQKVKFFLKMAFSSMVHLCTTMMPVRPTRSLSGCWTQHSYWYADTFLEQNVWNKYESAVSGRQGLIKAKEEANQYFHHVRIAKTIDDIYKDRADVFIATDSALRVLTYLNKNQYKVDYCFTDPPYNASIQYGELCYAWASWLRLDDKYLQSMIDNEVIENSSQHKDCQTYHTMLRSSLAAIYRVLKSGAYCHLTFHNPHNIYRNMTLNSAMYAGFDFEEVHHQEGARQSAKSLLQPFGSVTGDLYFRFRKTLSSVSKTKKQLSEKRFKTIVIHTALKVIITRGEPTPYAAIIEEMDKELYKVGFYTEARTEYNVEDVMKNAIGEHFTLVDARIGKTIGKLWWLEKSSDLKKVKVPLDERVEMVVINLLRKQYNVSFTEVWEKVAISFPNSLTPDRTSIRKTLEEYATQTTSGTWRIKPLVRERASQHSEMISMLAQIGKHLGYSIHVGMSEQRDVVHVGGKKVKLSDLCTEVRPKFEGIASKSLKHVNNIDIYWYRNGKIYYCFEVENTTSITSALERVSSVPYETKNVLILPEERKAKLESKMKLPMFAGAFKKDGWNVVYYNSLMKQFKSLMNDRIKLERIIKKTRGAKRRYLKRSASNSIQNTKPMH